MAMKHFKMLQALSDGSYRGTFRQILYGTKTATGASARVTLGPRSCATAGPQFPQLRNRDMGAGPVRLRARSCSGKKGHALRPHDTS